MPKKKANRSLCFSPWKLFCRSWSCYAIHRNLVPPQSIPELMLWDVLDWSRFKPWFHSWGCWRRTIGLKFDEIPGASLIVTGWTGSENSLKGRACARSKDWLNSATWFVTGSSVEDWSLFPHEFACNFEVVLFDDTGFQTHMSGKEVSQSTAICFQSYNWYRVSAST